VALAVTSAAEPVAVLSLAAVGGDRAAAERRRERLLRVLAVRVVAGDDEQGAGGVGANAVLGDQVRATAGGDSDLAPCCRTVRVASGERPLCVVIPRSSLVVRRATPSVAGPAGGLAPPRGARMSAPPPAGPATPLPRQRPSTGAGPATPRECYGTVTGLSGSTRSGTRQKPGQVGSSRTASAAGAGCPDWLAEALARPGLR
jgi:hypothetical protein